MYTEELETRFLWISLEKSVLKNYNTKTTYLN
jgi:hypothetical protein